MNMRHTAANVEHFIIYTLGLFLFLEWVYPIETLFESANVQLLIVFLIYTFLVTYLQLRWWLSFLLKAVGFIIVINVSIQAKQLFSVMPLYEQIIENAQFIAKSNWHLITEPFENMLFFTLIWLVSYLVFYWYIVLKNNLLFVLLTFFYITVLDTFTVYDGTIPIIRVFIFAILSFACVRFSATWQKELPIKKYVRTIIKYVLLLGSILSIAVIAGYIVPKDEPAWPDPVPFATMFNQNEADEEQVKKSGYGTNDDTLGGPFETDDTLLFTSHSDTKHYYKVETKDLYTGKGWERSEEIIYEKQANDSIKLGMFDQPLENDEKEAMITYEDSFADMDLFAYPYGTTAIRYDLNDYIFVNQASSLLKKRDVENGESIEQYDVTYREPTYIEEQLSTSETNEADKQARYTQLPDELPERIHELAEEIVEDAGATNTLEKAQAVEAHFSSTDFVYETTDVAVPEADEDYVDQFLFETQQGYCDNYSTSMVVLLRALDIEARWVKGFTGGDEVLTNEQSDKSTYEITNEHAHSWVEVYFAGVGWVPFEPTKGFTPDQPIVPEDDMEEAEDPLNEESLDEEQIESEEDESVEENEQDSIEQKDEQGKSTILKWLLITLLIIIAGLTAYLVYKRREIRMKQLYNRMTREQSIASFEKAFTYLLKLLRKRGLTKEESMTLREYAVTVDKKYAGNKMKKLATFYEQVLYNKGSNVQLTKTIVNQWKQLCDEVIKNNK